jgi:hypothetical protein
MKKNWFKIMVLMTVSLSKAQNSIHEIPKFNSLPPTVKYVDVNNDDTITISEAKAVFDIYRNNLNRKLENELVTDVESTVIELISYLEGMECNDIKKSIASKRFIEIYYNNKFASADNIRKIKIVDQKRDSVMSFLKEDLNEAMVTDRPDQTEAPVLTLPGFFQVEIGTQSEFDNDKINNVKTVSTLYNTTLWKYGVTKNFELRVITEYANDKLQFNPNSDLGDTSVTVKGFNPIAVGSKIHLQTEKGIIPEISLITHLELPYFGSKNYRPDFVIPRFRFLFAHTLSDRFSFSYNLGAEWENGTNAATGIYTASFGASLFGNLSMFVEAYGFLKENSTADNRLDAGFTYLINNSLQLDCSGGVGLSDISPDYFLSAGISFRFKAFKRRVI